MVDWTAFVPDHIERDLALFRGRAKQFIFISSASAYQKPPAHHVIRESTPLHNPYWDYARDKIACEERLRRAWREEGFPATIVRPSLTYGDANFPIAIGGWGCYTLADRLLKGRPIIVHGDGSSLWVATHAEDFARGFLGLLGNPQAVGDAFHITTDEVLTWNQIYETIADALGVKANMVHIATETLAKVAPATDRPAARRQMPGASSLTILKSRSSCRDSRPSSPSAKASAGRSPGSRRTRAAGAWTRPSTPKWTASSPPAPPKTFDRTWQRPEVAIHR